MLTKRDIKANPNKCETVINMRSPKSVKEGTPSFNALEGAKDFNGWRHVSHPQSFPSRGNIALIQEEGKNQYPIYFVNRIPKTREGHPSFGGHGPKVETILLDPILIDFIAELTPTEGVEQPSKGWTLSMDGASNQRDNGVGVMFKGINRVLIEQSLHLKFKANNN
ncbi:hypothetical protein CR513_32211, partial [Mucuna pruriens]